MDSITLSSGGGEWAVRLFVIAIVGLVVGFTWVRRIANGDEDPGRSFYRSHAQKGGGSRLPDAPDLPTIGWLMTRGAIVLGIGTVAFAIVGPLVMRRWIPALDAGVPTVVVWATGIALAVIGTAWMIQIARHGPNESGSAFRYRRRR
jgi:hypothetical protein